MYAIVCLLILTFSLAGCSDTAEISELSALEETAAVAKVTESAESASESAAEAASAPAATPTPSSASASSAEVTSSPETMLSQALEAVVTEETVSLEDIPAYSGEPYTEINGNVPYFTEADLTDDSYEYYSELDSLGRCGVAVADIGTDLMPVKERGAIGSVKPTGWHTVKYDGIDGNYLYNRCHLIGYQLSGENANEKNLITGTRYLNVEGMLPFENMIADYVKETENHVLYRVTPIFDGDNLVASGVLLEAESVEDDGEGILFCVYCYNVQPGIEIDYASGDSCQAETAEPDEETVAAVSENADEDTAAADTGVTSGTTYILNTNTMKFHLPTCSSIKQMNEENKQEYTGSREDVISQGYEPCKRCNP